MYILQSVTFSKTSFPIQRKTWYLNYLSHQMSLTNLKSQPTMIILNLRPDILNFLKHLPEIILNILKGINPFKAAAIDNLSGKFLKDGNNVLARPISHFYNVSIKFNLFPRICKIAKVKLLFKKSSKTDPQNCHPISILPILSKIIERVYS